MLPFLSPIPSHRPLSAKSHPASRQGSIRPFHKIATSGGIAAMSDMNNRIFGIQFHPEVTDTKEGKKILQNFLNISDCQRDWDPINIIEEIRKEVCASAEEKKSEKEVDLEMIKKCDEGNAPACIYLFNTLEDSSPKDAIEFLKKACAKKKSSECSKLEE